MIIMRTLHQVMINKTLKQLMKVKWEKKVKN